MKLNKSVKLDFKNLYFSPKNGKLKEKMKDESFKFPNITVNEKDYLKHLDWIKLFDKK